MIAWLRRMFARRAKDADLERVQLLHASRVERSSAVAQRAATVATQVVNETRMSVRDRELKAAFARQGARLRT